MWDELKHRERETLIAACRYGSVVCASSTDSYYPRKQPHLIIQALRSKGLLLFSRHEEGAGVYELSDTGYALTKDRAIDERNAEIECLRLQNDILMKALDDIRKIGHNVFPNRSAEYYQDALWDIEVRRAQASIDLQKLNEGR
jgi:hypothetical protein